MEDRKKCVAFTIAVVIQTRNANNRRVAICEKRSTVDGKNSEKHNIYVIDRTTVSCKSCCCSGKIEKKSMKGESNSHHHLGSDVVFQLVIYRSLRRFSAVGRLRVL